MYSLIQQIHSSPLYGIFIETGTSIPVASRLLDVSGASNTVYFAEAPYSKDYAYTKYKIDPSTRAVSAEFVKQIGQYYKHYIEDKIVNTIYVSSFQVAEYNSPIVTHGYIHIINRESETTYHITLRKRNMINCNVLSRNAYNMMIGQIGIKLLLNIREPLHIDIIESTNQTLNVLDYMCYPICWNKEGINCRLEDIYRDRNEIIIFKGSFNPPHKMHIKMMENIQEKYPNAVSTFLISRNNIIKGQITNDEIMKRVKYINQLKFNCMVINEGKFIDTINWFNEYYASLYDSKDVNKILAQMKLIFVVGQDIHERLEQDLFKIKNVVFEVFDRTPMSSTIVRKAIDDNNGDVLDEMVPATIRTIL